MKFLSKIISFVMVFSSFSNFQRNIFEQMSTLRTTFPEERIEENCPFAILVYFFPDFERKFPGRCVTEYFTYSEEHFVGN